MFAVLLLWDVRINFNQFCGSSEPSNHPRTPEPATTCKIKFSLTKKNLMCPKRINPLDTGQ